MLWKQQLTKRLTSGFRAERPDSQHIEVALVHEHRCISASTCSGCKGLLTPNLPQIKWVTLTCQHTGRLSAPRPAGIRHLIF